MNLNRDQREPITYGDRRRKETLCSMPSMRKMAYYTRFISLGVDLTLALQKLSRECVYTQTRPARRAGQGHSISSQDSMTDLTNSRESEHAPTLDRSLSSPRPFHEYQWSLPDLMTDNSWEQSDIPNANLAEFEKVLMDFSPSGVTGLTVPPNHTSCDIPSPTSQLGIFGGTCGSSNSNTFSSEFLDDPIHGYQRSESTQQTMVQPTYTHGEYRNEVLIRDFSGNRVCLVSLNTTYD